MRSGRFRKSLFAAFIGSLTLASVAVTHDAEAQSQGFNLNRFEPAPAGDLFFGVQRPTVDGELRFNAALIGDYAHAPLVLRDVRNGDNEIGRIVSRQAYLHFAASLALFDRLLLSVNVPIAVIDEGNSPRTASGTTFRSPDAATAGDARFGARVRLLGENDSAFQLALGAYLYYPTGSQDGYAGEGKTRVAPSLIAGGIVNDFIAWNVNLGMMFRRGNELLGTSVGNEFLFGAAVGVLAANKTFLIGPELYGSTEVVGNASAFSKAATNMELLGSIKYRPSPFFIGFGAGPGFGAGLGTPDFRMVATIGYAAWGKEAPPPEKPKDSDGDGFLDKDDACPTVPGVASADPTKNGCPAVMPDTDKDGIFDDKDACKDVPGVASDDPKKNGCPPDKDGDGIVDAEDACIDVPGVKDADPKKNGCPPDKDGDTVLDVNDACPDVAGPPDPDPKKNGCPLVQLTAGAIVINEQVHFATNKAVILGDSNTLLEAVAKVFKDHPEIKKVLVEGHTDNKGQAAYNLKLSNDRAAAVVKWLVDHGVEKARLTSKGFGMTKPIGDNTTDAGREANRRVEFKIVDPVPPATP